MKRSWMLALALALAATPARAHFLFLLPPGPGDKAPVVRLVFSDSPAPDDPKLLDKVKHTELFEIGPARKADPAATKLLADARAARANWENFPGFSADVEVNFDGKVTTGTVTADPKGKVVVQLSDPEASAWARRMLGSIVGHRLPDGGEEKTPCAFGDDVTDHPLGRAIHVLNDEFHSSYRVRDRQIIVVNRKMADARFTITVLANQLNEEKKFLPASYVVDTWDLKTGALRSSEANHQTWVRVGKYDLPAGVLSVTAAPERHEARSLKLTGHRLH